MCFKNVWYKMRRSNHLAHCPACGSYKIYFGHASDLHEYYPINPENFYSDEEYKMTCVSIPELFVFHCIDCGLIWDA